MEWHPPLNLTETDRSLLLKLARETLNSAFSPPIETSLKNFEAQLKNCSPTVKEPHPCFVTLLTHGKRLRGCIGSLSTTTPLYQNVFEFAQKAAFEDPRFPKLKKDEVASLVIEITVLGPTLPLPLLEQLEIGRHGLVVESDHRRGVLLAQVATEWKWDKKEFLAQTCLKAGLAPELANLYTVSYFEEVAFREKR